MAHNVLVIIPAYNEEAAIGKVIADIPASLVSEVVVVDNGSTDGTAEAAKSKGATVLHEPQKGYGAACLKGIEYAEAKKGRLPPGNNSLFGRRLLRLSRWAYQRNPTGYVTK